MNSGKETTEAALGDRGVKNISNPVIRRANIHEVDFISKITSRLMPALVISGAIHVALMGIGTVFLTTPSESVAFREEMIATTLVDQPIDDKENLTNEDVGFDADLAMATNNSKEEVANVEAPKSDDPIGLETQQDEFASQTSMTGIKEGAGSGADIIPTDNVSQLAGSGLGGGAFTVPGLQGRNSGATKDNLLKIGGGNFESEAAVARGLRWLAKVQLPDGSWEFDVTPKSEYRIAPTAMALLPFFAAGETHKSGGKYSGLVFKGLNWLMKRVEPGGRLSPNMYEQAIGAICLCEATGMTRDPILKAKARETINYIIKAQASNGSWGYSFGIDGDTSIVGWQIQALHSAKLAEIKFEKDKTYQLSEKFLNSVSSDSGSKYGYRTSEVTPKLIPVGLLSRYYMGWTPKNPAFIRGVDFIKQSPPTREHFDVYYYYYATQIMHYSGSPDWQKSWNPKMRELLIGLQNKSSDEKLKGSWEKDGFLVGTVSGRLGTTCLALLTLEVYYRHLPLYKRDSEAMSEMDR